MTARTLAALALATGLAQITLAQGRIEFQVSPALQENWSSSIDAVPGQAIDLRAVISYTGSQAPLGLTAVFYQPAISNWDVEGANTDYTDTLLPFVNRGGNGTTPLGGVPNAPGQYGRVNPFGYRSPDPNVFTPFNNTVGGISYLRISTSNHSNWVGEAGNTTGGGGVSASQPPETFINGNPAYPFPFDTSLTNLIVLKLGIVLSHDTDPRTLLVSTAEAFAGQAPNINTEVHWADSPADGFGNITGPAEYVPATIHVVPAPWSIAALGAVLAARRRPAKRAT